MVTDGNWSVTVGQRRFQGNGRVYVVAEAAALRQLRCFLPVLMVPGR